MSDIARLPIEALPFPYCVSLNPICSKKETSRIGPGGGCATPRPLRYDRSSPTPGGKVFERFTERARQVVVLAQDEARALKHNYIGTEHILLGLLREEEGLAARVLESLDITVEEVRAQVARIVGQGDEVTTGQIPFTPRAKK